MHPLLIDPYCSDSRFTNFGDLQQRLEEYYDRIYDSTIPEPITPRYFYEHGLRIAFRDVFYYIDRLYDHRPSSVIDVGCGECVWKRWFPNITGFDPMTNEFSQQDFVDYFDEDFSRGHVRHYDSGMALNSIHFVPWQQSTRQIVLAMNMVRDRFLFTFNFGSMSGVPLVAMPEQVLLFRQQLDSLTQYRIVMFDAPVLRGISARAIKDFAYVNGTVRFMLEHRDNGTT